MRTHFIAIIFVAHLTSSKWIQPTENRMPFWGLINLYFENIIYKILIDIFNGWVGGRNVHSWQNVPFG